MAYRTCTLALVLIAAAAVAQTPAVSDDGAPSLSPLEARVRVLALADARRWDAEAAASLSRVPDQGVRMAVAQWCGESARGDAAGLLARLAADTAPAVRAAAVESAGRLCAVLGEAAPACTRLVAVVRAGLGDADVRVRKAAAWAVGAGLPGLDGSLVARLGAEPDTSVRAAIQAELWRTGDDGWEAAAVKGLLAADPGERRSAAWSLGRGRRAAALPALRKAAADGDALVRAAALDAGRRIDAPAFAPNFAAALDDGDPRVRISALAGLEAAGAAEPLGEKTKAIVARTVADPAYEGAQERVAAIRAAGASGCCASELIAAATGGEPWVAGEALQALARQGHAEARSLVEAWLKAEVDARREAAVRAAARLADGASLAARALEDPSARVRLAAVEVVEEGERSKRLPPLFGDPDPAVRAAVVTALAEAAALPAAEKLVELIGRETGASVPDAAVALVEALAAGDELPEQVKRSLTGLTTSGDPVVARAAWNALQRHGVELPLPEVRTGEDESFYRRVVEWTAAPRWVQVVTWRGTMVVVLDTDSAPLTCYRLWQLAEEKYFDDLTFHRVVPNFVIQGGDPRGDGWGGPGFALRDELSLAPYEFGDVGMALAGPDTGGSQLFVTLTPQPHLVGRYPHVGRVVEGLEVATGLRVGDRIIRVRTGSGELPPHYPVWYGPLDVDRVEAAFPEYREEREAYQPDPALIAQLAEARLRYEITVAIGTWCSDSRVQIPRLEKVLDALGEGSPFERPRLIGVDRSKTTLPGEWAYGAIDLVPTIIISAGGAELGRIVETPATGSIEKDLVTILSAVEGFPVPE